MKIKHSQFSSQFFWILDCNEGYASVLNNLSKRSDWSKVMTYNWKTNQNCSVGFLNVLGTPAAIRALMSLVLGRFYTPNCSCPVFRSRPSSRGDDRGHDSIQEKFFQPRFTQVPEDVVIEEGRFCRLDFKVMPTSPFPFHCQPLPSHSIPSWGVECGGLCSAFAL